jgi:hypothetical protein
MNFPTNNHAVKDIYSINIVLYETLTKISGRLLAFTNNDTVRDMIKLDDFLWKSYLTLINEDINSCGINYSLYRISDKVKIIITKRIEFYSQVMLDNSILKKIHHENLCWMNADIISDSLHYVQRLCDRIIPQISQLNICTGISDRLSNISEQSDMDPIKKNIEKNILLNIDTEDPKESTIN